MGFKLSGPRQFIRPGTEKGQLNDFSEGQFITSVQDRSRGGSPRAGSWGPGLPTGPAKYIVFIWMVISSRRGSWGSDRG